MLHDGTPQFHPRPAWSAQHTRCKWPQPHLTQQLQAVCGAMRSYNHCQILHLLWCSSSNFAALLFDFLFQLNWTLTSNTYPICIALQEWGEVLRVLEAWSIQQVHMENIVTIRSLLVRTTMMEHHSLKRHRMLSPLFCSRNQAKVS